MAGKKKKKGNNKKKAKKPAHANPSPTAGSSTNTMGMPRISFYPNGEVKAKNLWWLKLGTKMRLKLLKNAKDLKGNTGVIVKTPEVVVLNDWIRVGVKLDDTDRVLAVKTENLDVLWDMPKRSNHINDETELCPTCNETVLIQNETAFFECCGGRTCKKCLEKQVLEGDPDTCPLCNADMSDDSEEATVVRIRHRANRGDPNACFNLGGIYDSGLYSVKEDQTQARHWYRLAAVGGEVRGAHNLACCYRDGPGPIDLVQALKYFRIAAEGGHLPAITNVGLAYLNGSGVARDIQESEKWLTLGAQRGDPLAQQQLGDLRYHR